MTIYCDKCKQPPLVYINVHNRILCRKCADEEYLEEVKVLKQLYYQFE